MADARDGAGETDREVAGGVTASVVRVIFSPTAADSDVVVDIIMDVIAGTMVQLIGCSTSSSLGIGMLSIVPP